MSSPPVTVTVFAGFAVFQARTTSAIVSVPLNNNTTVLPAAQATSAEMVTRVAIPARRPARRALVAEPSTHRPGV